MPLSRRQACLLPLVTLLPERGDSAPMPERPTLFLGDSITYSGQFIAYLEAYLRLLRPGTRPNFINCGLPSETVSGLTEPNHAGGAFPRPDLHERLERVLDLVKPERIIACYGMNDGIYHPFSEERFEAFKRGILRLREKAGVPVIHLTPPVFDPLPIKGSTLPTGRKEYPSGSPYEGYDTVLQRYSQWLLGQREQGWQVIDTHTPMMRHLETRRKQDAKYILAGDGVHLNDWGHWLITRAILDAWRVSPRRRRSRGDVSKECDMAQQRERRLTLDSLRLPVPLPRGGKDDLELFMQEVLFIRFGDQKVVLQLQGAESVKITEQGSQTVLEWGEFTAERLRQGIPTVTFTQSSLQRASQELWQHIAQRQRVLSDSYLTTAGHKRPGMAKGMPLEQAKAEATALESKIDALASAKHTLEITLRR